MTRQPHAMLSDPQRCFSSNDNKAGYSGVVSPQPAEFIQTGYPAFLQGNRHRLVGVLSPGAICRLVQ
jgi:hypothetical protein